MIGMMADTPTVSNYFSAENGVGFAAAAISGTQGPGGMYAQYLRDVYAEERAELLRCNLGI